MPTYPIAAFSKTVINDKAFKECDKQQPKEMDPGDLILPTFMKLD